ncbi:hypothetical protein GL213_07810 [Halogeometricum borinquense]|uniref:Small CPxCG-related zinc finger protein n=2 Tax=Halogeometricum borinquense TaxID=60847 RepID=E4NKY4_HALBP|nr:hypothetical protein [Halogeometricum borinquense]ADQ67136.1 hypothetical protein Hbor_15660 [Halogeometricum borinquense DSM 11551]ELY29684.1 hypothetical protein C499_05253 [Halogeometricum borinquense DSM 11551]QIB74618.1 hypothetical protein G3I44_10185 [Halogeometricum borinquense]QIQ76433.1 hypothetical protein GL213_07810 [Halogeometricum borinquense]RYJ13900.1 hypothetical protein ELS19_07910 [Halogeometricum borinquense]
MADIRRPSLSSDGAGWTVRQVTPRSRWRHGTEPCSACGASVELDSAHYQVELDRERPQNPSEKLTRERKLLSFCDEGCADDWVRTFDCAE